MSDRRTFLRSLASLPLIGGGITLIGEPTRVAQAATGEQIAQYARFCLGEFNESAKHLDHLGLAHLLGRPGKSPIEPALDTHGATFADKPSIAFRAPLVLSAAGVPLV